MKDLSQLFKESLINYLNNPHNVTNKTNVVAIAFQIHQEAVNQWGLEPDKYMGHMAEIVEPAVQGIKISLHIGDVFDIFIRDLGRSDKGSEVQAFHALTLAYNEYLKKNLIDPKEAINKQLALMRNVIEKCKIHNPYYKNLDSALMDLQSIVDKHFQLMPELQLQKQDEFEEKLKSVCSKHQVAIASNAQIKAVFYNFLAKISSILNLIGLSLSDKYKKKYTFFKDASRHSAESLLDFTESLKSQSSR